MTDNLPTVRDLSVIEDAYLRRLYDADEQMEVVRFDGIGEDFVVIVNGADIEAPIVGLCRVTQGFLPWPPPKLFYAGRSIRDAASAAQALWLASYVANFGADSV